VSCATAQDTSHTGAGASTQAFFSISIGVDGLPLVAYVTVSGTARLMHCSDIRCVDDNHVR